MPKIALLCDRQNAMDPDFWPRVLHLLKRENLELVDLRLTPYDKLSRGGDDTYFAQLARLVRLGRVGKIMCYDGYEVFAKSLAWQAMLFTCYSLKIEVSDFSQQNFFEQQPWLPLVQAWQDLEAFSCVK